MKMGQTLKKEKGQVCIVITVCCILLSCGGLKEERILSTPVIQITKALLDLSDVYNLSHSMQGLNSTALIYMGSLIKTIRCYLTALHW